MFRFDPLFELVRSRLCEFFREPEAIFWVYVFPVLLAIGLGIAFRNQPLAVLTIGIAESATDGEVEPIRSVLSAERGFECVVRSRDNGLKDLASGRVDLLIVLRTDSASESSSGPGASETLADLDGRIRYILDQGRAESLLARQRVDAELQRAAGRTDPLAVEETVSEEPGARYIDFLLPGLIGMNLLGGGMWGIGFVIVDMRVRKLLKRFLATPMRGRDFFLAIFASRLVFLLPEMVFLVSVAHFGFGMPFRGSFLGVTAIILVSSLSFSGVGLLIASRARKIETVSGLMNLFMLPMWLLSGIFFSNERFPDVMQPVIQILPLTAANDALRAVLLDGDTIWGQLHELGILAAWGGLAYALSLKLFRWT